MRTPTLYNDGLENDNTVIFSFKDPDMVIHSKKEECKIECPHHINECGCFEKKQVAIINK